MAIEWTDGEDMTNSKKSAAIGRYIKRAEKALRFVAGRLARCRRELASGKSIDDLSLLFPDILFWEEFLSDGFQIRIRDDSKAISWDGMPKRFTVRFGGGGKSVRTDEAEQ
jgi:hypothetical protein